MLPGCCTSNDRKRLSGAHNANVPIVKRKLPSGSKSFYSPMNEPSTKDSILFHLSPVQRLNQLRDMMQNTTLDFFENCVKKKTKFAISCCVGKGNFLEISSNHANDKATEKKMK